ncbi:MAG: Lysozyme inhibitor LprI [Mycobacterium sp.]|nr:Lysozyme inhibitor LprI [Mycobacterium sp.]
MSDREEDAQSIGDHACQGDAPVGEHRSSPVQKLCQWQAHHDPHRRLHLSSMQSGRDESRLGQCAGMSPDEALKSASAVLRFEMMKLCLIAVSAFVVAAAAGATVGPPVIREPWTPLHCPTHPSSTIEIEGCLERDVTRSDRRIDTQVANVFGLIKHPTDRTSFVSAEHSWLQYRRRSCSAAASVYRGGSAESIAYLNCQKSRNARHLVDLAASRLRVRE